MLLNQVSSGAMIPLKTLEDMPHICHGLVVEELAMFPEQASLSLKSVRIISKSHAMIISSSNEYHYLWCVEIFDTNSVKTLW